MMTFFHPQQKMKVVKNRQNAWVIKRLIKILSHQLMLKINQKKIFLMIDPGAAQNQNHEFKTSKIKISEKTTVIEEIGPAETVVEEDKMIIILLLKKPRLRSHKK